MSDDATRRVGDKVLARLGFAPTDLLYQRLGRVLQNRMRRLNIATLDAYLEYVEGGHDDELGQLAEALTINETYLFREPRHFEALKKLLPEIARTTDTIRILSAGCASGEEAYTLAMTASRTLGTLGKRFEVVGVDVDASALAKGREGLYSRWSFREEGLAQAHGFVRPEGEKWRIIPRIRETVRFEQINLVQAGPPGPFHVVFCRNMLMYLTSENRRAVVNRLIGLLPAGGVWFLGSSETLDEIPTSVERIASSGAYFYRKLAAGAVRGTTTAGSSSRAGASMVTGPVRIVTVTTSPLFRVIVRQLLRTDAEIELIDEAETLAAASLIASEHDADLIVVDAIGRSADEVSTPVANPRGTPRLTIAGPDADMASGAGFGTVMKLPVGTASALKNDPAGFIVQLRSSCQRSRRSVPAGATRVTAMTGQLRPRTVDGIRGTGTLRALGNGRAEVVRTPTVLGPRYSRLLLIGSSTGGPAAVSEVLQGIPTGLGLTILIVQHMPAHFTRSFAERLNRLTSYAVSEAATGAQLNQDVAYVAPGGMATVVTRSGALSVVAHDAKDIYVPNIDRAFTSVVAAGLASRTIAVVMTGMGDDGADGLVALQAAGADTIVQDPNEAVVPGMVRAAIDRGAGRQVLTLAEMPSEIVRLTQPRARLAR
jgi:two-component system, chemotaxis family, protein-glutamate methylesterase/glutaminase